jgi:hypothetical protein
MPILAIYLLGSAALLSIGFASGWQTESWRRDSAELTAQQNAVEQARALQIADDAANFDVGHQTIIYRDRVTERTITLTRQVHDFITPKAIAACSLSRGIIELHNANATSASAALPEPASGAVDAPSGVGIDTFVGTVVANYGTCEKALNAVNVQWPAWFNKAKAAYDAWAAAVSHAQKAR